MRRRRQGRAEQAPSASGDGPDRSRRHEVDGLPREDVDRGTVAGAFGGLDLESLYAAHGDALLVYLTRRTADSQIALDLWAESFAQAFEARGSYRGTSDAEAGGWLYGIARRQLAQYYRRGSIETRALQRLELERPPAPPLVVEQLERKAGLVALRDELRTALADLTPATRDAVQLRVVEELGYREVAERLGISEPTARVRVSRGLASLAELLDRAAAQEAVS
ncbi:MAG: RNA polymerase sigma factor [Solirubrobacteraceae bacterium]|nr:RNA polymerase sigma factor [Solirubrobacteraceae bacterium]